MEFSMTLRKLPRSRTPAHPSSILIKTKQTKNKPQPLKSKKYFYLPSTHSHRDFPMVWSELRKNMQLCDGIVLCEDGTDFKVHRAILSAVSPFFKAVFVNTLHGGQPEVTQVTVKVPGPIFSIILDYAYSGQCTVTSENVQSLLAYADQLEVLGVVQLCCQFFIDNLNPSNCLEVLLFAKQYFCQDLEDWGRRYIRQHFVEVMETNPVFYHLTEDELFDILSDDELNAQSEGVVFEAIKKWVMCEAESRKLSIPRLLTCVRLGLLAYQYYTTTVLQWKLILDDEKCRAVLQKSTIFLSGQPCDKTVVHGYPDNIVKPRVPYEVLFAIGGWSDGSPTSYIETYDCRADRWLLCVNSDITPRAYHGLCALDGLIYMIGGFDGKEHFNTVRSFNPVTREWREHACMYYPRCYVSVTMHDGRIYAIGGFNGRSRMSSAERYDPDTNQWELIASMQRQRSDASAAVLKDKVYIVGGFNGTEVLRSAEVYDPHNNQWSFVPVMLEARSGVSLLAFNGALYAFGGFNGYVRLSSAERFAAEQSEWTHIANMINPRSNFASVILDQRIYIVGGFNGSTTTAKVECYDATRDLWLEVTAMHLNRSALSACVLSGLSNAREYSYMYKFYQSCAGPEVG